MDTQATESESEAAAAQALIGLLGDEIEVSNNAQIEGEEIEEKVEEKKEEPRKLKAVIDGEEIEVTEDEAIKGYQRQADYTRKTMEVAEERKRVEAEKTSVSAERQKAIQLAEEFIRSNSFTSDQASLDKLLEESPAEYLKIKRAEEVRMMKVHEARQKQSELIDAESREQQSRVAQFVKQQAQLLEAKVPEWKDAAKAKVQKQELAAYLMQEGFTEQEIGSLIDHRTVLVARKAMLYDKAATVTDKKVAKTPPKVEKAGAKADSVPQDNAGLIKRLGRSNSVEDAAALIEKLM